MFTTTELYTAAIKLIKVLVLELKCNIFSQWPERDLPKSPHPELHLHVALRDYLLVLPRSFCSHMNTLQKTIQKLLFSKTDPLCIIAHVI